MPSTTPHRGSLLITLSICGWLVCAILSPITWIMARNDLNQMDEGLMDPSGASTTRTAKVIAMIHCILGLVSLAIIGVLLLLVAGGLVMAPQFMGMDQASTGVSESSFEGVDPAEQLSRIIDDLGTAVKQQMQHGRQLVTPLEMKQADTSTHNVPRQTVAAFVYSFPIVINGQRKDNLARHEGTFHFRDGHWHLDRVAVSFKFFDAKEFSPPVNILTESVETTPEFQSLKTMWLETVQQSNATMAQAKDEEPGQRGQTKSVLNVAGDGKLRELGIRFVADLNRTDNPPGGFNIGHTKDDLVLRTSRASLGSTLFLERTKTGYLESSIAVLTIETFQKDSWVKCNLDREYELDRVNAGEIRIKVSVKVKSVNQMWPSEKEHKVMVEYRKLIASAHKTWTGTAKVKNEGGKWQLAESADAWQKSFLESKLRTWDKMQASHKVNVVKHLVQP